MLSGFQKPKIPQKEKALIDPYGYWPEEIVSLSKINLNKFEIELKGIKPAVNTSNPTIPYFIKSVIFFLFVKNK